MSDNIVIFNTKKTPIYGDLNSSVNPVGKGKDMRKKTTKTRSLAKNTSELINPIFHEMALIETDNCWKDLFELASHGKFYRGFRFDNGVLSYKVGTKTKSCDISGMSVVSAIDNIKKFMWQHASVTSSLDNQNKINTINEMLLKLPVVNFKYWSEISGDKNKKIFIAEYVDKLSQKLNLNESEIRQLETMLNFGLTVKYLDDTTVELDENGDIKLIKNLYRDANGEFKLVPLNNVISTSKASKSPSKKFKKTLIKKWIDFLTDDYTDTEENDANEPVSQNS